MVSKLEQAWKKAQFDIGLDIANLLKIHSPVDTGRLRNSIKVTIDKGDLVISMVDYAKFVEFGAPPHIIEPKGKKVLRFEVGRVDRLGTKGAGKNIVFATKVHHPGNAPRPFIRPVLRKHLKRIVVQRIMQHMKEI